MGACLGLLASCSSAVGPLQAISGGDRVCVPAGADGAAVVGVSVVENTSRVAVAVQEVAVDPGSGLVVAGATLVPVDRPGQVGAASGSALGSSSQTFPVLAPGEQASVITTLRLSDPATPGAAEGAAVRYRVAEGDVVQTLRTALVARVVPAGRVCPG